MSSPQKTRTPTTPPVAAVAKEEEKPLISFVSPVTERLLQKLREFNGSFFPACELYDDDVRDSGELTQLAMEGDKCVGAVTCRREKGTDGKVAKVCIMSVAVLESHRRRGIGTMLLERVTDLCSQDRIPELYLKVENDNEGAIEFYEKFGFKTSNVFKIMALVPEAQYFGISGSDE